MFGIPQNASAVALYITIKWMFHYFYLIKLKNSEAVCTVSEGSLIFSIF